MSARPITESEAPATLTIEPGTLIQGEQGAVLVITRGAKIIARALRDAGMEVIYTGLHQTPEQIVETAIQEDADIIGLSILSGAHNTLFPAVMRLMREKGGDEVAIFGGGIIPEEDIATLKQKGVREIFTPGATTDEIVEWVRANVHPRG